MFSVIEKRPLQAEPRRSPASREIQMEKAGTDRPDRSRSNDRRAVREKM